MHCPKQPMLPLILFLIFAGCSKDYTKKMSGAGTTATTQAAIVAGITIEQLRNTKIKSDSTYITLDNGFNGRWKFDPSDIHSADNTGTLVVTFEGKRMKRILTADEPILAVWFDIKGNGTDETVKLQAAINASGGRTLQLPSGTFRSGKLQLVSDLLLSGHDTKLQNIQSPNIDDAFIMLWNLKNVEVSGVDVSLSGISGDIWAGTSAMQIQNSSNIHIHHCYIHDNTYAGIRLTGGNVHVLIDHNTIENTDTGVHANNTNTELSIIANQISGGTSEGITIYGYSENNIPSNFIIDSNIISHKDHSFGINIAYAKNGTIQHNKITDCVGGVTLHDVVSVGSEHHYTSDMMIRGNSIANTDFGIIYIGDKTIVENNILQNVRQDAINVNNFADATIVTKDVTISNNQIESAGLAGGARGAISVNNLQNSEITNNHITKCGESFAIRFSGDCNNLTIRKNSMADGRLESANNQYNKQVMITENVLSKTYFPPATDPLADRFKVIVNGNNYSSDTSYNTAPDATGIYSDLNVYNVRTCYSLAAGKIKTFSPSWTGRIIQLKSTSSFSIIQGTNIRLKDGAEVSVPVNQFISLQFDGSIWNEVARSF